MWVKIKGAKWSEGQGGAANYSELFVANRGEGRTEALAQGYEKGDELEIGDYALSLDNIEVTSEEGIDVVTITWVGAQSIYEARGPQRFSDGQYHYPNQTLWNMEMELDNKPAEKAVTYDGNAWSTSWGGDEANQDEEVLQPSVFLVQRKWMDKNQAGVGENPTTLPTTFSKAKIMINTYLNNAATGGSWEAYAPRLMCLLGGTSSKFLCVSITCEKDAELVLRTAKFKYKAKGWNTTVYGPVWTPT